MKHTVFTRRWLDRQFAKVDVNGVYVAHQPIYGVGHSACETLHPRRCARTFQMLRSLARFDGRSLLDVGGAEGLFAHLARTLVGYPDVVSADLSIVAARRAAGLFGLPSVAMSSHALPFEDNAFDVVVCSEVLEHVELPVETLAELCRVARLGVVLTTEECYSDRAAIDAQLFRRCGFPHFERSIFHPDDLRSVFGDEPRCTMRSQMVGDPIGDDADEATVKQWISAATRHEEMVTGGIGVHLVATLDPSNTLERPRIDDKVLLDGIVRRHVEPAVTELTPQPVLEGILAKCVCPETHSKLSVDGETLRSEATGRAYPVVDGVADLVHGMAGGDRDPSDEDCVRRFTAAFGASRVGAALALRRHLALPIDLERTSWDFGRHGERRGWFPFTGLTPRGVHPADAWAFESTSETPQLISPGIGRRAVDMVSLTITMRLHNPAYPVDAGVGQLFWLTDVDDSFSPDRHHVFPVVNDDDLHSYRIEFDKVSNWPRGDTEIVCLRIDPVNGPCSIELARIEFEVRRA